MTTHQIARAATRLNDLLADARVCDNPNSCACLDDLLGAVHALYLARFYGFVDRTDHPIETAVLLTRARDLSEGSIRIDGKWAAGFYFNGALFRLAAVFHRLLKLILDKTNSREFTPALQKEAAQRYPNWFSEGWTNLRVSDVYAEVNTLKHTTTGVIVSRTVSFHRALASLDEILNIAERWHAELPASVPAA